MIRFIARACGLALTVLVTVSPAQAEFKVGVAVVEITPMLCDDAAANARPNQFDAERGCFRWIHLAGFSPYIPFRDDNRLAEGVHDPLWSRALALEGANGEAVVLVATDLPGLSSKHTSHIRRRVALNHSIPRSNIIIHSTHTHSAPDGSGYWSTLMRGHNKHYTDYLRDRIYASIDQALRNLQPATMRVATTTHLACHDPRTRQLKKSQIADYRTSITSSTPPRQTTTNSSSSGTSVIRLSGTLVSSQQSLRQSMATLLPHS